MCLPPPCTPPPLSGTWLTSSAEAQAANPTLEAGYFIKTLLYVFAFFGVAMTASFVLQFLESAVCRAADRTCRPAEDEAETASTGTMVLEMAALHAHSGSPMARPPLRKYEGAKLPPKSAAHRLNALAKSHAQEGKAAPALGIHNMVKRTAMRIAAEEAEARP